MTSCNSDSSQTETTLEYLCSIPGFSLCTLLGAILLTDLESCAFALDGKEWQKRVTWLLEPC